MELTLIYDWICIVCLGLNKINFIAIHKYPLQFDDKNFLSQTRISIEDEFRDAPDKICSANALNGINVLKI